MEQLQIPSEDAVIQLQQMLETPIEDQAADYELALLGSVMQKGLELLIKAETNEEASEIMRQVIKNAFVIGRRHFNQLM